MQLHNLMESLAEQKLDSVLAQFPESCKCPQCRQDTLAFALNHLPPKYVNTDKGDLFVRLSNMSAENETKIIRELVLAVEQVAMHPRHLL